MAEPELDEAPPFCPAEPSADETLAADDTAFVARCQADAESASGGPVVFQAHLLTRSPTWGLVWRADVLNPRNGEGGFPLRLVCWKTDGGEKGMTVSGLQYGNLELRG